MSELVVPSSDPVADGVSGVLVDELSAEALAEAIRRLHADPDERRRLSLLGRIFAESEYSLAKSQQSFVAMLIRTGLIDRLRLPRNAAMLPTAPPVECRRAVHRLAWVPGPGVGPVEGPFPETGLPAVRWCEGPVSAFAIDALEDGPHRIGLTYANALEGQRVVVACNRKRIGEFELSADKPARHRLSRALPLKAGRNSVELAVRLWDKPDDEDRTLALMLVDVTVEAERTTAAAA